MNKTVVVKVDRTVKDPKYKKRVQARSKFKAHDERNQCRIGDRVRIVETRPLSRDKRWAVQAVVERAKAVHIAVEGDEEAAHP